MYLFSFKTFPGFTKNESPDKTIFSFDRMFYSSQHVGNPGDLLVCEDDLLLNLGEEISFPEMYRITYPSLPMKVRYAEFFDQHFLTFLHWMVYERYSSYKNVMKYFVNLEILELLKREAKLPSEKSRHKDAQTLVIFPDNWTRFNVLPPATFEEKNLISLVSTDTQNKKDLHRRSVKKGLATTIIATHSEVFQPFCNLKKILLYDPDKRYYNNQQDPRYTLPVVAEKMAEIHGAELVMK